MKIEYPIYFTKSKKNWENSPKKVTLNYKDETIIVTRKLYKCDVKRGDFDISDGPVSGYFIDPDTNEKVRVTNLVDCKHGKLRKECPHCGKAKPLKDFDDSGRDTSGRRDQSWCKKCR